MTARIYTRADWHAATRRRAQAGKAPRLSVQRGILLRQSPGGWWAAAIYERRYGIWRKPEFLCRPTTLEEARSAALAALRRSGLPLFWSYAGERMRAFRADADEPQAARA
jgi:hypothetical protein